MRIQKVERKVDTVILELDIDLAEKVVAIIGNVRDDSRNHGDIFELFNRMIDDARVRWPSPLYRADGDVTVSSIRGNL